MKLHDLSLLAILLLSGCSEKSEPVEKVPEETVSAVDTRPTLTAEELAGALDVEWAQYTLPGDEKIHFSLGAIIEYGDGRKPDRTGSISPAPGGSKVKLLAWSEGDQLRYSILAEGVLAEPRSDKVTVHQNQIRSGGQFLTNPFDGNLMTLGGELNPEQYLIRGTSEPRAALESGVPLKEKEFGLRLLVKPVSSPGSPAETAAN